MTDDIEYKTIKPPLALTDFVESFWMLVNHSESNKDLIILPDGRIDILFSYSPTEPFHVILLGLESEATQTTFVSQTLIFGVSLKLLATEYLPGTSVSGLLNEVMELPPDFWEFKKEDFEDFENACNKASEKISSLIKKEIDPRKQKLFDLIYSSNGSLSVKALSDKVHWSSRQINRYFNSQFGISLKAYCTILRFRASFKHIKDGKLFPEQSFADQAHFIKEVKKFSGVVPKELSKNKNDRFIQFSTLPKE